MKTFETTLERLSSKNFLIRFYKYYVIDSLLIIKRRGIKALIKERGWRVVAVVAGYYAIRDSILYILIPFLIAQRIL